MIQFAILGALQFCSYQEMSIHTKLETRNIEFNISGVLPWQKQMLDVDWSNAAHFFRLRGDLISCCPRQLARELSFTLAGGPMAPLSSTPRLLHCSCLPSSSSFACSLLLFASCLGATTYILRTFLRSLHRFAGSHSLHPTVNIPSPTCRMARASPSLNVPAAAYS